MLASLRGPSSLAASRSTPSSSTSSSSTSRTRTTTIVAGIVGPRRSPPPRRSDSNNSSATVTRAAGAADKLSGIVFEPFNEVKPELANVSKLAESADVSLARAGFTSDCEAALNEQINIEYNISYVYHAMYAYFSRDNVALPGFASYFKNESVEERHHAELLMDFQNRRGGRVKFQSILMPEMEFHDAAKGDALYAMELALSLEKLNFSKLRALHSVADAAGDANMCDFIEGELLADQAKSVEKVANYVAQLRRVGPGLGVFEFDRKLGA